MLSSTHSFVGATAGKYIPNPIVAFFVGIFLHFVFDKIPHFWPTQKKYENLALYLDTISTISIISFLLFYPGIQNRQSIVAGAMGGAFVDLCLVLTPKLNKSGLAKWHSERQTHLKDIKFILNDLVIIAAAIIIIFWFPS